MNSLTAVLLATAVIAGTGILAFILYRAPRCGTLIAVGGALVGGVIGLWAAGMTLHRGFSAEAALPWAIPGGSLLVGIDPMTAFFLVPLFVLGALCAVYGRSYLGARTTPAAEFNLMIAAMALVLVARHGVLFLVAWEVMTLLAYLLITLAHSDAEVRRAGWVYLIASHAGVLALFALFLWLGTRTSGELGFALIADAWRSSPTGSTGILGLALVGFGVKAGVFGLHVWLPEAHAAAPSHTSALMSAVMINLGLYGILRTATFVPPPAWFGVVLMLLGCLGALVGVVLALNQRDLKRILAYSSVENMGLILLGIGLGFWAQAHTNPTLAAVGFCGGFLHVWNHAAMKGLMFLGAGSVLHSTGTKDVERLGGLAERMRWTGRAMILGAVAIAGLPPLNGFTSEWLLYRGFIQASVSEAAPANLAAMSGAAVLALVGALAVLCFVRLVGVVLLGTPRSNAAASAHEARAGMTIPMWILAAMCLAGAVAAPALASRQTSVVAEIYPAAGLEIAAIANMLTPLIVVNLGLLLAIGLALAVLIRQTPRAQLVETWGCGYAAPGPRMQYTAGGFSELLTTSVLPRWLRPHVLAPPRQGPFAAKATFVRTLGDPLTRRIYEPLLVYSGHCFARLRFFQQGKLHVYLLYVLVAVLGGLAWVTVRSGLAW